MFEPFLPCDAAQLRKVYLRLALLYHPDKLPPAERGAATALFQAIAAVYEALLRPLGGRRPKRVKSQVAAAAELGDLKESVQKHRSELNGMEFIATDPNVSARLPRFCSVFMT